MSETTTKPRSDSLDGNLIKQVKKKLKINNYFSSLSILPLIKNPPLQKKHQKKLQVESLISLNIMFSKNI